MEVAEMRKVLGSETPAELLQDKLNSDTESPIKKLAELRSLRAEAGECLNSLEKLHERLTMFGYFTLAPIFAGIELAKLGDGLRTIESVLEETLKAEHSQSAPDASDLVVGTDDITHPEGAEPDLYD